MAITYYRITGSIRFYVDNELYSEYNYYTSYQRQKFIKDFLKKTKHITHRLAPYYICVPLEDTISKTTHTKNKQPIDYEHKINYVANNTRKYVQY